MTKYELLLDLIKEAGVPDEKIDRDKLKRQVAIITAWLEDCKARGFVEAITGFGKTWIGVFADYLMKRKYPYYNTIVVVPSLKLYGQWQEIIQDFQLTNIEVYVINTYTQDPDKRWNCDLLIIDEVHRCLSKEGMQFNRTIDITNTKGILGLSATLTKEEQDMLIEKGIHKVDKVGKAEGRKMHFVSEYVTYNLGLTLTQAEYEEYSRYNDIHNSAFARFQNFALGDGNWELAIACGVGNTKRAKVNGEWRTGAEWRTWYAMKNGWDGTDLHPWSPKNINTYANQWSWAMRERKNFLYNLPRKLDTAVEIIHRLKDRKIITFGETTASADYITECVPTSKSYHSNIKSETIREKKTAYRKTLKGAKNYAAKVGGKVGNKIENGYPIHYLKTVAVGKKSVNRKTLEDFQNDDISCINTAKALNEGFNVEGIDCGIIYARSSKSRTYIQRIGRAIRFVEGKEAIIINIYVKNSQDQSWLERSQKGETNIRFIDNVNQLPVSDAEYSEL